MSVIYLECAMGAAGDMLTAALLELHHDPKGFIEKLNNCGIPGTVVETETSVKCGISGTHMRVYLDGTEEHHHNHHGHTHHHSHEHMNVHEIEHIIGHLHIDNEVKNNMDYYSNKMNDYLRNNMSYFTPLYNFFLSIQ